MSLQQLASDIEVYERAFPKNSLQHNIFQSILEQFQEILSKYRSILALAKNCPDVHKEQAEDKEPSEKETLNLVPEGFISLRDFLALGYIAEENHLGSELLKFPRKVTGPCLVRVMRRWYVDQKPFMVFLANQKNIYPRIALRAERVFKQLYPGETCASP